MITACRLIVSLCALLEIYPDLLSDARVARVLATPLVIASYWVQYIIYIHIATVQTVDKVPRIQFRLKIILFAWWRQHV